MTPYAIEEIYEMVDAIHTGRVEEVCEELGDALFHLIFIIQCYAEQGRFTLEDVVRGITEKMIRRHPHVFASARAETTEKIRQQWHEIKQREHHPETSQSILDSIPIGLPALMRAYRISERAAKTGFDWEDTAGVIQKVEEEWRELKSALKEGKAEKEPKKASLEFGDVLFTLVNVARFARIHPETALTGSIQKFEQRFRYMEKRISEQDRNLDSFSQAELETLWEEAKQVIG